MTDEERRAARYAADVELLAAIEKVVRLMPPADEQPDALAPSEGEIVTSFVVVTHSTSLNLLDNDAGGRYSLLTPADDIPPHAAVGLLTKGQRIAERW